MKISSFHECFNCNNSFKWFYNSPSESDKIWNNVDTEREANIYLISKNKVEVIVGCPKCRIPNKFTYSLK